MNNHQQERFTVRSVEIHFPTILFFSLLLLHFSCAEREIDEDTIVASVGDARISVRDFRVSYELAPLKPKISKASVADKKRMHLQRMVQDKLLARAGLAEGRDHEAALQKVLRWYEKQEVVRELYRQEVSEKVQVSEDEARDAFVLLNEKVLVRQVLVRNEKEAAEIYQRLRSGESFKDIAMARASSEEELERMLSPQEFTWGELDENLETAIFGLNKDEVSAPVRTASGYHIVQLVNRKENILLTEHDYQERRHYIETIIRRRKEAELARGYARFMMESLRPRAVTSVLLELTHRAKKTVRTEETEKELPPHLQIRKVRSSLSDLEDKDLIVYNGGTWTVGQFLDLLENMPPANRPDLTKPGTLQVALSVLVRDEFLADEGYKRDLDQSENVRSEVARVREEIVASTMRNALLDTVSVTDSEIQDYYTANLTQYEIPEMVHVREVLVRDRTRADSIYQAVLQGADLSELAKRFSVRKWAGARGGDLGFITKAAFGSIGQKAVEMAVGEIAPPTAATVQGITVGYSVFAILEKQTGWTKPLSEVYDQVVTAALKSKRATVLERFLNEEKKLYPVHIDDAILSSIRTLDEIGKGRPMDIMKITRL